MALLKLFRGAQSFFLCPGWTVKDRNKRRTATELLLSLQNLKKNCFPHHEALALLPDPFIWIFFPGHLSSFTPVPLAPSKEILCVSSTSPLYIHQCDGRTHGHTPVPIEDIKSVRKEISRLWLSEYPRLVFDVLHRIGSESSCMRHILVDSWDIM